VYVLLASLQVVFVLDGVPRNAAARCSAHAAPRPRNDADSAILTDSGGKGAKARLRDGRCRSDFHSISKPLVPPETGPVITVAQPAVCRNALSYPAWRPRRGACQTGSTRELSCELGAWGLPPIRRHHAFCGTVGPWFRWPVQQLSSPFHEAVCS